MAALDGDGDMLKDHAGTKATRDIVQFVPFSRYNLVRTFLKHSTYQSPDLLSFIVQIYFLISICLI